jgi:hypothetical protein
LIVLLRRSHPLLLAAFLFNCTDAGSDASHDDLPADGSAPVIEGTAAPSNLTGPYCFLLAQNNDITRVSISLVGDSVTGTMDWQPAQKDGARGTLYGRRRPNGELALIFDYTIEGNRQTETKTMRLLNNQLQVKHGPLEDPAGNGRLRYQNEAQATYSEVLSAVDCEQLEQR